jgi:tetratricopeptide (TPR) repeat protein
MSSVIEFPLTSPCPANRDAILSWVVEGSESPAAASARAHLNSCDGCKAFRDALKVQRALLSGAPNALTPRDEMKQLRVQQGIASWIDNELKSRRESSIAHEMWLCAESLLRLDLAVSRSVFTEGVDRTRSSQSTVSCSTGLSSQLASYSKDYGALEQVAAKDRSKLTSTIERIRSQKPAEKHESRIDLIRVLARLAPKISEKITGPMYSILANTEWYYGDESMVLPYLEKALDHASTPSQRAHAVANLGVWESSKGRFSEAIELGRAAIQVYEGLVFPRMNSVVWLAISGDMAATKDMLVAASLINGRRDVNQNWPWGLLVDWLQCGMAKAGASERDLHRRIDSLRSIYRDVVAAAPATCAPHVAIHQSPSPWLDQS